MAKGHTGDDTVVRPSIDTIPAELTTLPRWLVWRNEKRKKGKGKPTKIPYDPRTGAMLDATKPTNGTTFAAAHAAYLAGGYSGLGFILGDGIAGIDVDDCIEPATGALDERGVHISERFRGTYAEVSPSGTGFKVLVRVSSDTHGNGKAKDGVEVYSERRYFAITGALLKGHAHKVRPMNGAFTSLLGSLHVTPTPSPAPNPDNLAPLRKEKPGTADDLRKVRAALKHLSSDDYATWQAYAAAMRRAFRHDEQLEHQAFEAWLRWSETSEKFVDREDCERKWATSDTNMQVDRPITLATIIAAGKAAKASTTQHDTEQRNVGTDHGMPDLGVVDTLPKVRVYIPDLLTSGLYLLISQPKTGKTWMMLQMAYALATGAQLWGRAVQAACKVCVMALEEGDEFDPTLPANKGLVHPSVRIARRLHAMGCSNTPNMRFIYELPPGQAALDRIEEALSRADVLFIDSMVMLRIGAEENNSGNIWNRDYSFIKPLQRIASAQGKAIVLLAHSGKGANQREAMDAIAGTQGIQAATDGMMVLQSPDKDDTTRKRLSIVGRDLPNQEYELRWMTDLRLWQCLGQWITMSPREREVLTIIAEHSLQGITYEELAELTGTAANVRKYGAKLIHAGLVHTVTVQAPPPRAQGQRAHVLLHITPAGRDRLGLPDESTEP